MKKTMLFICASFFGYEKRIKETFSSLGFEVTYLNERPYSILHRYYRLYKKNKLQVFYGFHEEKLLNKIYKNYDYLFVIKSEYLSESFYEKLFNKVSFGKKILYEWDSLLYIDYKRIIPFFDVVYSFDRNDCNILNINYLPLFWTKENINKNMKVNNDIFFCGSMNADRQEILLRIKHFCKKNNLRLSIYLYTPITTLIKLLINKKIKLPFKDLHLLKLTHKNFYKACLKSRSVLDINTTNQNGLTMRTFEVLSLERYLLTTNTSITDETGIPHDRYYIFNLSDSNNWKFNIPENNSDNSFLEKYSIESWCKNIIM